MPIPEGLPVVDHHCHLSPSGEGVEAARRFRAAGGTHLFLATQNYTREPVRDLAGYAEQYATTERLARRVTVETGVTVFVVIAPYPVDLIGQADALGLPAAIDLQRAALELAGRWVEEDRAVALGEVGRPHFPVAGELAEAAEDLFRYALEVARDAGCPAVVHSEDLDASGYARLAELAAQVSFPPGKLVKHYARAVLPTAQRVGVVPSFVARREVLRACLAEEGPWFLETDFLDDPARPGAVLDLATVPRRAAAIAEAHPEDVERLWIPFDEAVRSVYGLELAAGGRT